MKKIIEYIFGFVMMFVFSYVIFFFFTGFSEGPIRIFGLVPIITMAIFLYIFGIIGYKLKERITNIIFKLKERITNNKK